jgi:hypothetical protein
MCEAVDFALDSHGALKQIFILSDREPISMAEMIILLRSGSGLNGRGLRVSPVLLSTALRLLGRHEIWQKIGENLVTSVAKLERFGFRWRTNTSDALRRLGTQYARRSSGRDPGLIPNESVAAPISTHKPTS